MTAFSDDDEDGGATFAFWHFRFTDLPEKKIITYVSSRKKNLTTYMKKLL